MKTKNTKNKRIQKDRNANEILLGSKVRKVIFAVYIARPRADMSALIYPELFCRRYFVGRCLVIVP